MDAGGTWGLPVAIFLIICRFFRSLNPAMEAEQGKSLTTYLRAAWVPPVIAVLWAAIAVAVGLLLVLWPFSDWEKVERIAVMEVAVTFAGFGAGLTLLRATASQLSEYLPQARFELRLELAGGPPSGTPTGTRFEVIVRAENIGERAVAPPWQLSLMFHEKDAQPLDPRWTRLGDDLTLRVAQEPLFPREPVDLGRFLVTAPQGAEHLELEYRFASSREGESRRASANLMLAQRA